MRERFGRTSDAGIVCTWYQWRWKERKVYEILICEVMSLGAQFMQSPYLVVLTLLECSRSVACNIVVFRVKLNPNLLCGHVT